MFSRNHMGPVQFSGQRLVKDLIDQRAFSGTGHASHTGHHTQGKGHVDILQVVFRRSPYRQVSAGFFPLCRNRNFQFSAQIGSGNRIRIFHQFFCRPDGHQFAAVFPRSRSDVHHTVRRPHGVLIMFHHNQSIAKIPQVIQRLQQFVIVSLVQSDAGFIQNICHPHQAGADLRRQTDPLRLASGQRPGSTGKSQVFQSHIHQKAHSGTDLFENLGADHLLHLAKVQIFHKFLQTADGHIRHFKNVLFSHRHRQGGRLQPLPLTLRAGGDAHERFILCFHTLRPRLPVPALHIFYQPFKGHIINAFAPLSFVMNFHLSAAGAMDQNIPDLLRIILKGSIQAEIISLGQSFQDGVGKAFFIGTGLPAHHRDSSLGNTFGHIRNHQIHIKFHPVSQSGTGRAGSKGVVKGKAPRFDFFDADAAVRTGKTLGKLQRLLSDHIHHQQSV